MNEWGVALLRRLRLNRWSIAHHTARPEGQKYTFRATTADGMRHSIVDYIIHSRGNVTIEEVCADYHEQASDHVMLLAQSPHEQYMNYLLNQEQGCIGKLES